MTDLVLGTAQFGSGYGVTNLRGRIPDSVVQSMLRSAVSGGIRAFDTAADYDDAQSRLGRFLPPGVPVRVVSKFRLSEDGSAPTFHSVIGQNLQALNASSLYGLLLHRVSDLDDPRMPAVLELLAEAQSRGVVECVGVSIYDEVDLDRAISRWPNLNLIQIPASIADQRLLDNPVLQERHESGTVVHARSAFLQGLLLAEPSQLEGQFARLAPTLASLDAVAQAAKTTPSAVALAFLRHHHVVDAVIVGVTSGGELEALLSDWSAAVGLAPEPLDAPEDLLDPRKWQV